MAIGRVGLFFIWRHDPPDAVGVVSRIEPFAVIFKPDGNPLASNKLGHNILEYDGDDFVRVFIETGEINFHIAMIFNALPSP